MIRPMTVGELSARCLYLVSEGLSDKQVLISSSYERNVYHGLFFGFNTRQREIDDLAKLGLLHDNDDPEGVVLLG